ncbi:hypothetical protein AYL99_07201 [Fonsecaea erecta]|uniref:Secreted protein n=1 Tax=Fonsecaea erecta TaxID=1367422 RepID=A0A178ZF41_9EURO|nr:hypothetical protein AYL99_07201 [Fonsecaea erecta]OAP58111.1 hypothetical protein AYL99_07201 [Fonsecaea erecta]
MLNLLLRLVAVAACAFGIAMCACISDQVFREVPAGHTSMCIDQVTTQQKKKEGDTARFLRIIRKSLRTVVDRSVHARLLAQGSSPLPTTRITTTTTTRTAAAAATMSSI